MYNGELFVITQAKSMNNLIRSGVSYAGIISEATFFEYIGT